MTVGERIKKVRRALDLTQTEFAARIKSTQNSVTRYETGDRSPSPAVVSLICREFNVDEGWLVDGNGGDDPVFVKPEKFSLDEFVKTHGGADFLELQIIKSYFELPKATRRMLVQHFQNGLAAASEEERKSMRELAADLYDKQNQAEEKPDTPASSANGSAVG